MTRYNELVKKNRLWIYDNTPRWFRGRDFEVFIAVLCFIAGVPLLTTDAFSAPSLESQLPYVVVKIWALVLTVCPIIVISGMVMVSRVHFPNKIVWLRYKALGLIGLAYAGYVYAFSILSFAAETRWVTVMITLGFALTCHSRENTLQVYILKYRSGVGLDVDL